MLHKNKICSTLNINFEIKVLQYIVNNLRQWFSSVSEPFTINEICNVIEQYAALNIPSIVFNQVRYG